MKNISAVDVEQQILGSAIIDTHDELVAAWRAVKDLPSDHPRVRKLVRAPVSEDELFQIVAELSERRESAAGLRAERRARWVRESIARYRRVARGE